MIGIDMLVREQIPNKQINGIDISLASVIALLVSYNSILQPLTSHRER